MALFSIQSDIEDYLASRCLDDLDGYAVKLANLYFHERANMEFDEFVGRAGRIRSLLFERNRIKDRAGFARQLVGRLDTLWPLLQEG